MSSRRGMHKVEFFTHIDEIKSMYESGYVVLKILYEELKKRHNWSMSYWSFCKYMKEEVLTQNSDITPKSKAEIQAKKEASDHLEILEKKEQITFETSETKPIEPDLENSKGINKDLAAEYLENMEGLGKY